MRKTSLLLAYIFLFVASANAQLAALKTARTAAKIQAETVGKIVSGESRIVGLGAVEMGGNFKNVLNNVNAVREELKKSPLVKSGARGGIDKSAAGVIQRAAANNPLLEDKILPCPFKDYTLTDAGEKMYFDSVKILNGEFWYDYKKLTPRQMYDFLEHNVKEQLWDRINRTLERKDLTFEERRAVLANRLKINRIDFGKGPKSEHFLYTPADPVWDEINNNLKYPKAKKHAILINGKDMDSQTELPRNFIVSFAGSETKGLTSAEFENVFKNSGAMGGETLVYSFMHGNIDKNGAWYGAMSKTDKMSMTRLLDSAYSLRSSGKTEIVDIYLINCFGGKAFDEAMAWTAKLPEGERQFINLFVPAGGRMQVNTVEGYIEASSAPVAQSVAAEVIGDIDIGNIAPKIYLRGREINILKESVNRARALGNAAMADGLSVLETVAEAGSVQELHAALQSPAFQNMYRGRVQYMRGAGITFYGLSKVANFSFTAKHDSAVLIYEDGAEIGVPQKYRVFVTQTAKDILAGAVAP